MVKITLHIHVAIGDRDQFFSKKTELPFPPFIGMHLCLDHPKMGIHRITIRDIVFYEGECEGGDIVAELDPIEEGEDQNLGKLGEYFNDPSSGWEEF